jgi:hypothetical protein
MNDRRFFWSFNEDCQIDRKMIKYVIFIFWIPFILICLNILPLKKILHNEYLRIVLLLIVSFSVELFFILFLDIMPNIFINIPRIILIIIALILIPTSLLVIFRLNQILGFSILILINYIIGYDVIFNRRNIMENIFVSLIRFMNFIISICSIFVFLLKAIPSA